MAATIVQLRAVLAGQREDRPVSAPRVSRHGTKQEKVLAMLRRTEGASGPQIMVATGWAPHTVRGFLAGLKKKGMTIEVLERIRQGDASGDSRRGS